MGDMSDQFKVVFEKPETKEHFRDLGLYSTGG
jgi:hypothetical protein